MTVAKNVVITWVKKYLIVVLAIVENVNLVMVFCCSADLIMSLTIIFYGASDGS